MIYLLYQAHKYVPTLRIDVGVNLSLRISHDTADIGLCVRRLNAE